MSNKLKAITTKAKQLYKTGKFAKWTDAIKAASKSTAKVGANYSMFSTKGNKAVTDLIKYAKTKKLNRLQVQQKMKAIEKQHPEIFDTAVREKIESKLFKVGAVKKKTAIKKAAPKKAAAKSYHKDTKSHNVKISVMSGISKTDFDFWVSCFAPRTKKLQLEWYRDLIHRFKTGNFDVFLKKDKAEAQLRALEYILNKKPYKIK
jgi:hypothetical protein